MIASNRSWDDRFGAAGSSQLTSDRLLTFGGMIAVLVMAMAQIIPATVHSNDLDANASASAPTTKAAGPRTVAAAGEWAFGGYGGIAYTHPSEVRIENPGRTDLTVTDFGWIGRPFKSPIYYGIRIQRWLAGGMAGTMLDFTHAKAISQRQDEATFSGTLNGQPVTAKQKMDDVFRHLEFSHGHNMLTFNGLLRLAPVWSRFRPYVGAGAGISLPHSEVGIHAENARTYEYHFAGYVGQALAGLEIQLGRASLFLEYKFSYAPYDIPLSHEPYGWLLVTDLWRQFTAWWNGEAPPGGRLRTTLATHHGIGGVMVRTGPTAAARPTPPAAAP
ncbi:MAG: hypothetical protein ACR2O4_02380 [Hyphomicrobiaceae bacterium]